MGKRQIETPGEILSFIAESNKIERIDGYREEEVAEYNRFMALQHLSVEEVERFVSVYQPNATLRDTPGQVINVGNYFPPASGPFIRVSLKLLLEEIQGKLLTPYQAHIRYEKLHPFTDGNGRSGRMIWKWMMRRAELGFLHTFYYQTLEFHQ